VLEPIVEVRPRADWDAAFQRTLTDFTAKRPRRWRFGIALTVPAVVLAASLTGGVLWVQAAISNRSTVHCFAQAQLDIQGNYPGVVAAKGVANRSAVEPIKDPVGACSALWAIGELDASAPGGVRRNADGSVFTGAPTYPVPTDLRVCVMRDGSAAVIPGRVDVCAQLGLARLG